MHEVFRRNYNPNAARFRAALQGVPFVCEVFDFLSVLSVLAFQIEYDDPLSAIVIQSDSAKIRRHHTEHGLHGYK